MGRQVYINVKVGNSDVDQDKLDRAEAAALAVIAASGSTVDQVRAEFVRQWAWLATDEAVRAGRFQEYAYLEGSRWFGLTRKRPRECSCGGRNTRRRRIRDQAGNR